jgi:hypothetical protein
MLVAFYDKHGLQWDYSLIPATKRDFRFAVYSTYMLVQGWANFFVGGPNGKSKISGGPTYFLLAILVNNNKPETQTRAARITKQ